MPCFKYPFLFFFVFTACQSSSPSPTASESFPTCQSALSDPDGDGWGWESEKSCRVIASKSEGQSSVLSMKDGDVWNQELRVLTATTPKILKLESLYADLGYPSIPSRIFARKRDPTAAERKAENIPNDRKESAAHCYLMRLGQQIYQQALLASKSNDLGYADNAAMLIKTLVDSKLGFMNDPTQPSDFNDNRYLEMAWFLSLVARGAHIIDVTMPADWKVKSDWTVRLKELNDWIGPSVDQNWAMSDALNQSPINLASQAGTMNWVGNVDTQYGATNRTMAMLEAQFRVAELRGGRLGPMKMQLNAWQKAQGLAATHDGSLQQLFANFRGYLAFYFNKPVSTKADEYNLRFAPQRDSLNSNPNALNSEPCLDPLQLGYKANCLLTKDAYRNDTYHAQMGMASVLHIMDIAQRSDLLLSADEQQKVVMGLRWTSVSNVPGVIAAQGTHGIAVWELAFKFFSAEELGPYCQRDLAMGRSRDANKRSALAWGFSRVASGF